MQDSMHEAKGDNFIFEGGLSPMEVHGISTDFIVHPLAAKSYCGDGVKDVGEDCDTSALGSATCISRGYSAGSLLCTAQCTFNESGCTQTNSTASSVAATTGNTGHGGQQASRSVVTQDYANASKGTLRPSSRSAQSFVSSAFSENSFASSSSQEFEVLPATIDPEIQTPSHNSNGQRLQGETLHASAPTPSTFSQGIVNVVEVGMVARLASMYRFENLYNTIPAFEALGKGVSPLLAMRPGSVSVQTIAWPIVLWKRRKKKSAVC